MRLRLGDLRVDLLQHDGRTRSWPERAHLFDVGKNVDVPPQRRPLLTFQPNGSIRAVTRKGCATVRRTHPSRPYRAQQRRTHPLDVSDHGVGV
ncbi:MAG: hypothetical protein H0V59_05860, partial [Nocardioidaceae bacterium]|nr:hypothetical protein [Nocardioidaceae bacterium]